MFLLLIAVSLPFTHKRQSQEAQPQRVKLAHAENKLEQFIVILRDIFEYIPRFLLPFQFSEKCEGEIWRKN